MMKYTLQGLLEQVEHGSTPEYIFFWGGRPTLGGRITKTCLSQWFPCRFETDGVTYFTAEQYMMAQKALLFGDRATRDRIMVASDPATYKALGRKIKPFDGAVWDAHKKDIVVQGNLAKFGQNEALRVYLLGTGDSILVEASPYDTIWGIGLPANTEGITDPHIWQGENLLGFALMEVRDALHQMQN